MRRLLLLFWLALLMAVFSAPAVAAAAHDCPMARSPTMAGMAASHGRADCCLEGCAADCAAVCPGTVMTADPGRLSPPVPAAQGLAAWSPATPESSAPATVDPPPRTTVR